MPGSPGPRDNHIGDRVFQAGVALAVLATVAVLLRFIARWKTKARFAADDLLIVISLLPFYGMVILSGLGEYPEQLQSCGL